MTTRRAQDIALIKRTVQWRGLLARSLPHHGKSDARKLALCIVEGLVFLKLAQHCKLEPARGISNLLVGVDAAKKLLAAFVIAGTRYHSSVFAIATLKTSPRFERSLRDVIRKISIARIGHLAPSMLGEIYASDVDIARHEVHQTPDFISEYLVRTTLRPLLARRKLPVVLDPACGAGAFPLKTFAHILRARPPNLTLKQRQRVLLTSIHGVDIDAFGVELAKLSLLLALFSIRGAGTSPLPNAAVPDLSGNIRCGNTLTEKQSARRSFDAVLVNPPFINIRAFTRGESRALAKRYACARGAYDLYVVFLEQGLRDLKAGGRLGSIVPSSWISWPFAKACRRMLLGETRIESITDISPLCVFSKTHVYPTILVCENAPSAKAHTIDVFEVFSPTDLLPGKRPTRLVQRALNARSGFRLYS